MGLTQERNLCKRGVDIMAKTHNLAYDYSVYDRQELEAERKIKHRKNLAAKKKRNLTIKTIGIAVAMMALMCSMIYGKVELSSLYTKQAEMQTELTELQDENISFESELASKTGLTKVEEYAEDKLGLQKLDKSQIEYVTVPQDTVAEVVKTDDANIFVKIKRWFSNVLEYIGA